MFPPKLVDPAKIAHAKPASDPPTGRMRSKGSMRSKTVQSGTAQIGCRAILPTPSFPVEWSPPENVVLAASDDGLSGSSGNPETGRREWRWASDGFLARRSVVLATPLACPVGPDAGRLWHAVWGPISCRVLIPRRHDMAARGGPGLRHGLPTHRDAAG